MPKSTNEQVINAFITRNTAKAGTLHCDFESLYSYDLEIARWIGGQLIVFDYTATGNAFCSMTTSQHVSLIKRQVGKNNIMLVEFAEKTGLIR